MNKSFLSIVDKGDPSGKTLLVRARQAGDIKQVFPDMYAFQSSHK